jgi:PEP-CTERM motif
MIRPSLTPAFLIKFLGRTFMLTLSRCLIALLCLAAANSAFADTINILSGSAEYGPGGIVAPGVVSLIGDRGFTFNGSALGGGGILGPPLSCIGIGCSPGTTVSLLALWSGNDLPGQATLDGVFYPNVGDLRAGSAQALIDFSGELVAPPFGQSSTAILTTPVSFSGLFFDGVDANQLVAPRAIATLTLQQTDCCGFGPAWRYTGVRYDIAPVPEPGTLLLFGSAVAGLGLAWRRRSR